MNAPLSLSALAGAAAWPLDGSPRDFERFLELARPARFVLLGEASHGTHEFYRVRAELTKRLIADFGFDAVAVEADWPDAARVDRFVRGRSEDRDAVEALAGFERFPRWMWRNADVLDFVGWLRGWNESHGPSREVGFYGLDLYSLHRSIAAVIDYLRIVDPEAARRAKQRYACFEHAGDDPQRYGWGATFGLSESCEREVLDQLVDLLRKSAEYAARDGRLPPGEHFHARQNARLVVDAEAYYRSLFAGRAASWNLRDAHMAETLDELARELSSGLGRPARIAIWAHNSHLGDARATDMRERGEHNLGQLLRQRHGSDVVALGFTTFAGTVTAADDWDEPARRLCVRDALSGSWERLLHDLGVGNLYLDLHHAGFAAAAARHTLLERAIGVVYRPRTERSSHYFHADLPRQFDALLHYDVTRAVEPLEPTAEWRRGELPETYPSAL